MPVHYKLSPSATKRWINCPGSLELSRQAPEQKESIYAAEGTKAHAVAETCLLTGEKACKVSDCDEMAEAVQVYLDDIDRARKTYKVVVEHTERTLKSTEVEGLGGTSDHIMVYFDGAKLVLHVWDYKHGQGVVVDAEDNMQALSYFAILRGHYAEEFDAYRITIVQPRGFGEEKIRFWECSEDRVQQHIDAIKDAIGKDHLRAGDWCRWCPALRICPEVRKHALEVAQTEFDEIRDDTDVLLELVRVEPAIRKLLDLVPGALLEKFRRGEQVPGYKVIEKRSFRRWKCDDPDYVTGMLEEAGFDPSLAFDKVLKTPPKLEKELPDKKLIADHVHQVVIGYKVVPVSARGNSVDLTNVEEFDVLDGEFDV